MMESLTNEIYEEGLKVINEVRPGVCLNLKTITNYGTKMPAHLEFGCINLGVIALSLF